AQRPTRMAPCRSERRPPGQILAHGPALVPALTAPRALQDQAGGPGTGARQKSSPQRQTRAFAESAPAHTYASFRGCRRADLRGPQAVSTLAKPPLCVGSETVDGI